jgi:hypothetical protein
MIRYKRRIQDEVLALRMRAHCGVAACSHLRRQFSDDVKVDTP